jgi:hypothetical protein
MDRNPFLDFYAGVALALGGPISFLLPQRSFLAMLNAAVTPDPVPVPVRAKERRR